MKNLDYHISKGADDHYYILNCGTAFIKTLSTDLETAKIKAKSIVGSDVPVDVWHRKKSFDSDWKPQQDAHVVSYEQYLFKLERAEIEKECNAREYVGQVGETLIKKLSMYDCQTAQSSWGEFNIIILEDLQKNRYIYLGNAKCFNKMEAEKTVMTFEFEIKNQYIHDKYLENTARRKGKSIEIPYKMNQICRPKYLREGNEWVK